MYSTVTPCRADHILLPSSVVSSQAQAKREQDEHKRQEALARKAELKRLQEQEEAALSRPKPNPKAGRVSGPKVGDVCMWHLTCCVSVQCIVLECAHDVWQYKSELCNSYSLSLLLVTACRSPIMTCIRCVKRRLQPRKQKQKSGH